MLNIAQGFAEASHDDGRSVLASETSHCGSFALLRLVGGSVGCKAVGHQFTVRWVQSFPVSFIGAAQTRHPVASFKAYLFHLHGPLLVVLCSVQHTICAYRESQFAKLGLFLRLDISAVGTGECMGHRFDCRISLRGSKGILKCSMQIIQCNPCRYAKASPRFSLSE